MTTNMNQYCHANGFHSFIGNIPPVSTFHLLYFSCAHLLLVCVHQSFVIFSCVHPVIGHIYLSCVHLSLVIPPHCVHLSLVITFSWSPVIGHKSHNSPVVICHWSYLPNVSTFHWSSFFCDLLPLVIFILWSPVIGHNSPVVTCHWSSFFSWVQVQPTSSTVIRCRKMSQDLLVISSLCLLNVFFLSKATSCGRFHAQKPFMSLKRFPKSKPKLCNWTTKHFDTVDVWSSELLKISLICLKY